MCQLTRSLRRGQVRHIMARKNQVKQLSFSIYLKTTDNLTEKRRRPAGQYQYSLPFWCNNICSVTRAYTRELVFSFARMQAQSTYVSLNLNKCHCTLDFCFRSVYNNIIYRLLWPRVNSLSTTVLSLKSLSYSAVSQIMIVSKRDRN